MLTFPAEHAAFPHLVTRRSPAVASKWLITGRPSAGTASDVSKPTMFGGSSAVVDTFGAKNGSQITAPVDVTPTGTGRPDTVR